MIDTIRYFLIACLLSGWASVSGQPPTTFPTHGIRSNTPQVHAFKNCTLVISPGEIIENGVLVIRDGVVENSGQSTSIPPDAVVHDLHGAWVYPGFIDAYAAYGISKPERQGGSNKPPQFKSLTNGAYGWNEAVKPEFEAVEELKHAPKQAQNWRAVGFTTVNAIPRDGIFRGTATLINLGNLPMQEDLVSPQSTACMSFRKGVSRQSYPSSLMGSIALIRQTFIDAAWYQKVKSLAQQRPGMPAIETNLSLEALNTHLQAELPFIFECDNWQDVTRAARIGREFQQGFIYKTAGDSYKRIPEMKALNSPLIVPLKFPKAPDINSLDAAREVNLGDMLAWEKAPMNAGILAQNDIPFALTTYGLKGPQQFWSSLQKAIQNGLHPHDALAALTTQPAAILGVDKQLGNLNPGKIANFIICDSDIFQREKPTIFETWVRGQRHVIKARPEWEPAGQYRLAPDNGQAAYLLIGGKATRPLAKVVLGTDTLDAKLAISGLTIKLNFPASKASNAPRIYLDGIVNARNIAGTGTNPAGERYAWTATRIGDWAHPKSKPEKDLDLRDNSKVPPVIYPNMAFGQKTLPQEETVIIQNATVWTNTSQGKLEGADVVISGGKVQAVGKGLMVPPNARVIDGKGKHVTPGIIDEHSHIAISRGVNEGSHAVTAEVSIGHVVQCEDINIYRQLAGGVTTSQLLHGSANPIGGQSAIIKLRWGATPEGMQFAEAAPFIKFALGENVKQSNWGDNNRTRYPQTRLGVEQVMKDAFSAARDYEKSWKNAGNLNKIPPRRDLQMEAVLQILNSERFISCHSYQQGEINMLMKLAEAFGFRVNTFTHVLEGYKVADKLKAHGATASTFSDWWAYKFEVIDAIPYNAAVLHSQGVNTCINSDDAEMGRRLNQEAAKGVKYGGLSEEDALKLVTLNPAKALHLDKWVGSIEPGKHGDIVVWTDHPLSIYARPQQTFIDGRRYFDADRDKEMQAWVKAERKRLLAKVIATPAKDKSKSSSSKPHRLYECETIDSEYNQSYE